MIRILIADDHSIVRHGLKQIVSECPGMVVAGEAASGQEVLDLVRKHDFDVAIVDIAMPGRGGLEILKDLKAEKPLMKVMVLSMYSEEQYAIRSFRDGASAYLTKASAPDELVQAIRTVAKGKRYITPSVRWIRNSLPTSCSPIASSWSWCCSEAGNRSATSRASSP